MGRHPLFAAVGKIDETRSSCFVESLHPHREYGRYFSGG